MTNTQQQLIDRLNQPDVSALSDADAAASINADLRTASPIPLSALRQWANFIGLQSRLGRSVASPAFAAVCNALKLDPVATADSANDGLSYISGSGNANLDTTNPQYADKTHQLLQLMVAVNGQDATVGMTAAQAQMFLSFGGGIAWGPNSVAVDDVTAARAATQKQQTIQQSALQLRSWLDAAYATAGRTIFLGTQSGTLPTQAQLQALFAPVSS